MLLLRRGLGPANVSMGAAILEMQSYHKPVFHRNVTSSEVDEQLGHK